MFLCTLFLVSAFTLNTFVGEGMRSSLKCSAMAQEARMNLNLPDDARLCGSLHVYDHHRTLFSNYLGCNYLSNYRRGTRHKESDGG